MTLDPAPHRTTRLGELKATWRAPPAGDGRDPVTELAGVDRAVPYDPPDGDLERRARLPLHEVTAGFARYEVRRELGRGGMGAVLLAYDPALRREVALKVLIAPDPPVESLARFVQEAQLTGQLAHPGIPPVHELGATPDGRPYYAMKVVRGASLSDRLEAARTSPHGRSFPLARRIETLIRIGEALDYAHAQGVIHRDLKPDNILVGEFGEVLVMDWGLAKVLGAAEGQAGNAALVASDRDAHLATVDGVVAGTPAYMAPEQARGDLDALDVRTDVFALGALLYEMLALRPPYVGGTVFAVLEQAGAAEWMPIPERIRADGTRVPTPAPELVAIAHRALARVASDRYPTARALVADLRAYLAHEPVSVHRDGTVGRVVKATQRHPGIAVGAASALAILVLATLLTSARQQAESTNLRAQVAEERSRTDTATAELARRDALVAESERQAALAMAKRVADDAEHRLSDRSRTAIDAYNRLAAESSERHESPERFERSLASAEVESYLRAFNDLFSYYESTGRHPSALDHTQRARLLRGMGRYDRAQIDLEAALALVPGDVRILIALGVTRGQRGDTAGAIADFDRALAIDPRDANAWAGRGNAHVAGGDPAAAIADYDQALALDAGQHEVWCNRGVARKAKGDVDGAISDYDRALALEPRSSEALRFRAMAREARREWALAIADYDRAIQLDADDARALRGRGYARHQMGYLDLAIADYDRSIQLRPADAETWSNRGATRSAQRDVDGAIADYTRAIELDPRAYYPYLNRGNARMARGDADGAVMDYDRALELDPACWRAAANRGTAYATLGKGPEALSSVQLARRLCPDAAMRAQFEAAIRKLGGVPE